MLYMTSSTYKNVFKSIICKSVLYITQVQLNVHFPKIHQLTLTIIVFFMIDIQPPVAWLQGLDTYQISAYLIGFLYSSCSFVLLNFFICYIFLLVKIAMY